MTQWDKLIYRLNALSKDMRFFELRKILENCGYRMESPSGGSSHFTFRKQGKEPITIPKHNPIKVMYVKKVRNIVENEGDNHE